MASYTDIIPQFNPYIQQLPVEAMVYVGMEKQRRYDEGIQKIQTQIDNIAGLDIIRDVDRSYLQSKLNELGSNLMGVAAGDFSNFQLVNSVGGMVNQVSKDPIVQNAVNSTALYRKEYNLMEEARKEGKSSIQNQWDFKTRASNWLYSKDLAQSFNETYTPYIDVDKKWLDVMKTLHSDLTEQDIAQVTVTNADGTVNTKKTLAAMQRVSRESVSAEKIENALRASLTPDDLNQLNINGRYEFRGYDTPQKLEVYSKTKYGTLIRQNEESIKNLEGYANLKSSNPAEQQKALATIEQLKARNSQLKLDMDEEIAEIYENPDQAKATIYKNGAISQFAVAHSWEHKKDNLLQSPVLENEHWEKNYALDRSKFNLSVRSQNWNEYIDKEKLKIDKANLLIAQQKLQAQMFGGNAPFETYLGENTNIQAPLTAMNNDVIALNSDANTIIEQMAKSMSATVGQVESSIREYSNGNPDNIPVEWRDEVDRVIANRNKATRINEAINTITNEVDSSADFTNMRGELEKAVQSLPSITIKDAAGRNVVFSQKEILNYLGKRRENVMASPGGVGGATVSYEGLTDKEKLLYSAEQGAAPGKDLTATQQITRSLDIGSAFGFPSATTKQMKTISDPVNDVIRKYDYQIQKKMTDYQEKRDGEINNRLMQRTGKYVPRLTSITFSSEGGDVARRTWEGIASSALQRYETDKGGAAELSEDDIDTGLKALTADDRQKIIYKKLTQGDDTYVVMITPGGKEITVPLTEREAIQLPITDPNEPSPQYVDLAETLVLGNGNTNPNNNPDQSYFTRANMPYINRLNVKGDVTSSKTNSGKKFLTLRLNIPGVGWSPLKLDKYPMPSDGIINFVNSLTDDDVKQLYLSDPRVPAEWKTAIQSIK
jgi:hypothetical protein